MLYFNRFYYLYSVSLFFCLAMAFSACSDENDSLSTAYPSDVPVLFHSNLGVASTRVADGQWSSADKIGIYMLNTKLSQTVSNATFALYKPKSSGTDTLELEPYTTGGDLYYPVGEVPVSFVAFAPNPKGSTSKPADPTKITYTLTGQTSKAEMEAVDYVYCNTKENKKESDQTFSSEPGNSSAVLNFTHKLSKVVINVTREEGLDTDLTALKASISTLYPSVVCNLGDKGKVTPTGTAANQSLGYKAINAEDTVRFEVIVAPHENADRQIEFVHGTTTTFPAKTIGQKYEEGLCYTYKFTLKKNDVTLTDINIKTWGTGDVAWNGKGYLSTDKHVTLPGDASTGGYLVVKTDAGPPSVTLSDSNIKWIEFDPAQQQGKTDTWHIPYRIDANPSITSRLASVQYVAAEGVVTLNGEVEQQCLIDPMYPTLEIKDANCIIVPPGGHQAFIPVSRVNDFARIYKNAGYGDAPEVDGTTNLTAYLLWTDGIYGDTSSDATKAQVLSPLSVINRIGIIGSGADAYIYVQSGSLPGNAVVALSDGTNILWSWHIWVTSYDPDKEGSSGEYTNSKGSFRFMDRNLGATSNQMRSVSALGLLYQWGRKDPFTGAGSVSENIGKAFWYNEKGTDISWKRATDPPNSNAVPRITILESVRQPLQYYTKSSDDWCDTKPSSATPLRWYNDNGKSFDDPCPVGWTVPHHYALDYTWHEQTTMIYDWGSTTAYRGRADTSTGWWPAAGSRSNNEINNVGTLSTLWTYTYQVMSGSGFGGGRAFDIYNNGFEDISFSATEGATVRCVAD